MKQIILPGVIFLKSFISNGQEGRNSNAFFENFSDSTSTYFKYGSTGNKADFKWKPGVNSLTEPGTKIMSFKIDPNDSAGAVRGQEIISNVFTHI